MKGFITNRKSLTGIAIGLFVLMWGIAAATLRSPLLLPTPWVTLRQLFWLAQSTDFWGHLSASLGRGLTGFGLAFLTGTIVGMLAGRCLWFGFLIRPGLVLLRSTPSMSLILLALIWFKGEWVALFVIFLVVFPMVVQNIVEGVRQVDPVYLELAKVYRLTSSRIVKAIYLPALVPFLGAALSSGLGMTWKVLIAAEVLSYPKWGIGVQMDTARVYFQTERVFAWTLIVVLIGLGFDLLLEAWFGRMVAWRGSHDGSSRKHHQTFS